MSEETVIQLATQTLHTVLLVSLPMLGAGLVVGIAVSLGQVITSIQDMALAFVPRILITFVVFLIIFPWMLGYMVSFTEMLLTSFDPYIQ